MEKNYYDWLEVNINASPEIIEKAYKTLVKKYHPDLQPENKKQENEAIIKKINEAYDILSNEAKRNEYNKTLKNKFVTYEKYNNLYNEKLNLEKEIHNLKSIIIKNNYNDLKNINNNYYNPNNINNNYYTDTNNNINSNYNYKSSTIEKNNYNNNKIHYKKNINNIIHSLLNIDIVAFFITILIFIFIGFIMWHIPFTKNYIINFYNTNPIFKFLVDFFISFFN